MTQIREQETAQLSATNAASGTTTVNLACIQATNTKSKHVAIQMASASSNYQVYETQPQTTFINGTDGTWQLLNNGDLAFIKTANTPNGHVEVHISTASSNYQARTVQTPTTFVNGTDGIWQLLSNNDLAFIKTANTPNGHVEVHIASASSNYQTRTVQTATTFANETNGTWQLLSNNDLAFIKTANTPNGHVEVHIASASSNYQTRTVETPTTFINETDGTWQIVSNGDLAFIKTANTPSGCVEVHIASASSNYQTRTVETATTLLPQPQSKQIWTLGSFDLNATILAVELLPQQTNQWCWAASGEMIMKYLGKDVSQCNQANNKFGQSNCCISPTPVPCVKPGWPQFAHWGFNSNTTNTGSALSFIDLENQFTANDPVAFSWAWTGGGGHMMVARGIKKPSQMVYINDPWAPNVGNVKWIAYSAYVSGSNYNHLADIYNIINSNASNNVIEMTQDNSTDKRNGFENANEAAVSGVSLLPSLVSNENYQEMGFQETINPNKKMEVGVPFQMYFVRHDSLKAYTEDMDSKNLLTNINEYIFPVYYDGDLVSAVSVNLENGKWYVKSIGDSTLIKNLVTARQASSESTNMDESKYFVVQVPSLYHTFLAHEQDGNMMITHIHDNNEKSFIKNNTRKAVEVIKDIQSDALLDNFSLEN